MIAPAGDSYAVIVHPDQAAQLADAVTACLTLGLLAGQHRETLLDLRADCRHLAGMIVPADVESARPAAVGT